MRALRRKLLRDSWHYRSQFAAIAVVMACGVSVFVALRSMHGYLRSRQAAYYAEQHFAELFAQVNRAPASVAERLRAIPGVQTVETRVTARAVLEVPGLQEPATGWLVSIPDRPRPMLNDLVIRSGRYPAAGRGNEVLVSDAFAQANQLRSGDSLGVILQGRWETIRIAGTAISPEFIYEIPPGGASVFPDNRRYGVIWMQATGLAAALDMTGAFNDVTFTLAPGAAVPDVIAAIDAVLARYGGLGAFERKDQVSDQFVSSEIEETRITSLLLPAIFLGVTAFLLNLVLSRLVATEREQIAVLKAFGYGNGAIALHYLGLALVPVGAGTLVGGGLGIWMASGFARIYARFYQFPDVGYHQDLSVIGLAVVVSGGAALVGTLGAVRRALRLPPAEAMRPEAPASFHGGGPDRLIASPAIPLAARTVLRNIRRRPSRALLSVTGLALAVALTVVGRFMFDAVDFIKRLEFFEVWRQDVSVGFDRPLGMAVRYELARLPGVLRVELVHDVPVRLRYGAASERTAIEGLESGSTLRRIMDARRAAVTPPAGGLLLTTALARKLGVGAGDTVRVEVLDGRRRVTDLPVAGVVDELLGLLGYMELDALHRQLHEPPRATGALLSADPRLRPALNARLKSLPRVSGVTWLDALLDGFERTIAESFRISIVSIVVFAVVIAVGVVYNAARVAPSRNGVANWRASASSVSPRARWPGHAARRAGALAVLALPAGLASASARWLDGDRAPPSDIFRLPLVISGRTTGSSRRCWSLAAAIGTAMVIARRHSAGSTSCAVLKTRE